MIRRIIMGVFFAGTVVGAGVCLAGLGFLIASRDPQWLVRACLGATGASASYLAFVVAGGMLR